MRWEEGLGVLVDALTTAGFLDANPLRVHGWYEHGNGRYMQVLAGKKQRRVDDRLWDGGLADGSEASPKAPRRTAASRNVPTRPDASGNVLTRPDASGKGSPPALPGPIPPDPVRLRSAAPRFDSKPTEGSRTPGGEVPEGFTEFAALWPKWDLPSWRQDLQAVWIDQGFHDDASARADMMANLAERRATDEVWQQAGGKWIPTPMEYLRNRDWEAPAKQQNVASGNGAPHGPPSIEWRCAFHQRRGTRRRVAPAGSRDDKCDECRHAAAAGAGRRGAPEPAGDVLSKLLGRTAPPEGDGNAADSEAVPPARETSK